MMTWNKLDGCSLLTTDAADKACETLSESYLSGQPLSDFIAEVSGLRYHFPFCFSCVFTTSVVVKSPQQSLPFKF